MDLFDIVEKLRPIIREPDHRELLDIRVFGHLATRREQNGIPVNLWSDAFDAALRAHNGFYIPASRESYCIERPIVLQSGQCIRADREARICAAAGMTACMVRNQNLFVWPEDVSAVPDTDITVTGGIWSCEKERGERAGQANEMNTIEGARGAFLFSNVDKLSLTGLHIVRCPVFAVQIGNARNLFVSDVVLESYGDGVHLNGPADGAVVQNISGTTGDDFIALNAWDWVGSGVTFGRIQNVLVRNISASGGCRALRLLAGQKQYGGSELRECSIGSAVIQGVRGISEFKLYAQPKPYKEKPDGCGVGRMDHLFFNDILVDYPERKSVNSQIAYAPDVSRGVFEILADVERIRFDNIRTNLRFDGKGPALVDIGPKSATRHAGADPFTWEEVFLPDGRCTVDEIALYDVYGTDGKCTDGNSLVNVIGLSVNGDYPRTLPRGGTGFGRAGTVITG